MSEESRMNQIVFSSSPAVKDPSNVLVDEQGALYSPNHIPRGECVTNVLLLVLDLFVFRGGK